MVVHDIRCLSIFSKNLSKKFKFHFNRTRITGTSHADLYTLLFEVRKSVYHHTIQIIQPTRFNSFTSLLLDVYVWLNMFRVSPRPSPGAYNCTRSLWFYRWRAAVGALLVVVCQTIQPTRCNSFTSLLLDVYMWLNMFRASPRSSPGAYNCTRSL